VKRGDLYRLYRGLKYDPKNYRVVLVVSRQEVIDNTFTTVICAPVYSKYGGLPTQVEVGVDEGLKHDSAVYCDELYSVDKTALTDFIGSLPHDKMEAVNVALRIALAIGASAADSV
jgi:mRNA interferase MazF